jgi:hypothetical protein
MRTLRCTTVAVVTLAVLGIAFTACSSSSPTTPDTPATPIKVLMLTATTGFRHGSIDTARQVMTGLAATSGEFSVTPTEDVAGLTAVSLASYDVLFFALTSGELPFTADQKAAISRSRRVAVGCSVSTARPTRCTSGPSSTR